MSGAARGFTLIEVLLAALVLACGAISAAFALGQGRELGDASRQAATARYLLDDGVAWARSLPRVDRVAPVFGREAGETGIDDVDDVDDLDGLVETGPVDRAGDAAAAGWQRRFVVESVSLADPAQAVADGSTTLLRVQVAVVWAGSELGREHLWLARVR